MEAVVCARWVAESVRSASRGPLKSTRDRYAAARLRSFDRAADPVARPRRAARPARDRRAAPQPLSARATARRGIRSRAGGIDDRGRRLPARGKPRRPLSNDFPDTLPAAAPSSITPCGRTRRRPRDRRTESLPVRSAQHDPESSSADHVRAVVRTALLEDLGRAGDITADAIVPADQQAVAGARARASPASSPGSTSRAAPFSSSHPRSRLDRRAARRQRRRAGRYHRDHRRARRAAC